MVKQKFNEVLNKLQNKGYLASTLSTYDFSTLYTTLPHDLIKDKLTQLIKKTFQREKRSYLACNAELAFFTDEQVKHYTMWTCSEVCEALTFLLDNILYVIGMPFIVIGIYMGKNCTPIVAAMREISRFV